MRIWMMLYIFWMVCPPFFMLGPQEQPKTPAQEVPYIEREEKEFSFYPGGKLEIAAGIPGNIRITGWQRGSVRMEAEKIVYYRASEEVKALLQDCPIKVRYTQTSATVSIPASVQPGAALEFNIDFRVPGEKTDLTIVMARGDFSIASVNGWVEVTTGHGSLDAKDMAGYFSASTQKGDIYAEMSGKRWRGLEFAALTRHGSVNLRLPLDYSASLQLETRNGKIVVDYPPRIADGEPEPAAIITRKNSQLLKAAVGEGGAPIKLTSYSGDIKLSSKE